MKRRSQRKSDRHCSVVTIWRGEAEHNKISASAENKRPEAAAASDAGRLLAQCVKSSTATPVVVAKIANISATLTRLLLFLKLT